MKGVMARPDVEPALLDSAPLFKLSAICHESSPGFKSTIESGCPHLALTTNSRHLAPGPGNTRSDSSHYQNEAGSCNPHSGNLHYRDHIFR